MTTKHPALLVEDGATFHACIVPISGGQFQASCHAELDKKSSVLVEEPFYGTFDSKHDARIWVQQQAAARRFPRFFWSDEFSAKAV